MDLLKVLALLQSAEDGSEYLDYAVQRVLFGMAKPVPLYTRSLDAALLLLPDGWTINRLGELSDCRGGTSGWLADIYRPGDAVIPYPCEGTARSAALALCIAGVRTRLGMLLAGEEPIRRNAAG